MKVRLVAVGKIKERFYSDAVSEYAKRLSRFCSFSVHEVPEVTFGGEPGEAEKRELMRREGDGILRQAAGYVVALDRAGEELDSPGISKLLGDCALFGDSTVSFVIGGSYGLSQEVLSAADFRLSFGKVTYPHQLMRVIAAEQIYRAFMIRAGSTYHK